MQVGTRIVYDAGNSVVQGASSRMVPSSDGGWVDDQGRKWREDQLGSSGGVGFITLDIVQTTPNFVAADQHMYLSGFNRAISLTDLSAVTGNNSSLGSAEIKYWIHPARLARMGRGRVGGHQISPVRYRLGKSTVAALSISDTSPTAYSNEIYDLKTGLLLSSSRSNRGGDQMVRQAGQLGTARGAIVNSHVRLIGTRKRQLPWGNTPAPSWVKPGRRFDYQGQVNNVMLGNTGLPPYPPSGAFFSCSVQRVVGGCVLANTFMSFSNGNGIPPSESRAQRCYASTSIGSLWIPPSALAKLRPNQVIDQDMVTRFRVTYLGIQNGTAIFSEQGSIDQFFYAYNPQNGMLVGFDSNTRPTNIAEQRRHFRLVNAR